MSILSKAIDGAKHLVTPSTRELSEAHGWVLVGDEPTWVLGKRINLNSPRISQFTRLYREMVDEFHRDFPGFRPNDLTLVVDAAYSLWLVRYRPLRRELRPVRKDGNGPILELVALMRVDRDDPDNSVVRLVITPRPKHGACYFTFTGHPEAPKGTTSSWYSDTQRIG